MRPAYGNSAPLAECWAACLRGRLTGPNRLNNSLMLAMLVLHNRHNLLCDSTLRNTRNCIDGRSEVSHNSLPKQQHVVSNRASDTIGCGFAGEVSPVFR